ncbi:MAG: hypothetical protein J7484_05060 [Microbacterium sp.]|nr:hypothetical protein [Microbacterium sp.]
MSEPQQPSVPPHEPTAPQQPLGMPQGQPPQQYTPQYTPQPLGQPQYGQAPQYGQPAPQPQYGQPGPQQPGYAPQQYGQPQGAPGYGAQEAPGYPAQGLGYPGQVYTPAAARPAGSLGRTAFILALVGLGVGLLMTLLYPLMFNTLGFGIYGLAGIVNFAFGFVVVAASVAALAIGLVAIRRQGPKILAGIAVGIAAAGITGTLVSWLTNLVYLFA